MLQGNRLGNQVHLINALFGHLYAVPNCGILNWICSSRFIFLIFFLLSHQGLEADQTDLRREIAFNLSLIYQSSGNIRMARKLLYTYGTV